MKLATIPLAAATVLVLMITTACSSGTAARTAPVSPSAATATATTRPASTPPSTSATPTATVAARPTVKMAGQHYLVLAAHMNVAGKALGDAAGWTRLSTVRKPLTRYAAALDVFARGLLSYDWPPTAMPVAKRLASAVLRHRADMKGVLASTSDSEAVTAFNRALDRDASTGIATELRIALGLASN